MINRFGIGGNAPPLSERLTVDHESLASEATSVLSLPPLSPIMVLEDCEIYSERAKELKRVLSKIESARKLEKEEFLTGGKIVDAFFATLSKPVEAAATAIISKLNHWQKQALEAERKARAEQERQEKEAARVFGDEPPPAPVPVVAKEAARVVSSSGRTMASAAVYWNFRVTDPAKVPRQYLMVNEMAIKSAIAGGVREIDGVEIFEDLRTSIR